MVTFLTKSSNWFLGPIATVLGWIMNGIYEFFHLFGIQNIALSIIVFTFIVKTLMLPLTIKQQKFTKLSAQMNPELQKIQAKYKGKKDEASMKKQQAETQAVYQKFGANPTSGCLPLIITLPIMFALYQVINNIPAYVGSVKSLYEAVALPLSNITGFSDILKPMAESIKTIRSIDLSTTDGIINVLTKFPKTQWDALSAAFPTMQSTISTSFEAIKNVNSFLGLNVAEVPGWKFPGIIVPILAMALQFVQGKQIEVKNKDTNKDNPTASAMSSMNVVMPIMSGIFCVTLPTGIGLYWIATSVYAIIQQYFVNKYMDKIDVDQLIAKNVAKASKRHKFVEANGLSIQDLAKKQTKSIESTVSVPKENNVKSLESPEEETETVEETRPSGGKKSISEIANLLKNRNEQK